MIIFNLIQVFQYLNYILQDSDSFSDDSSSDSKTGKNQKRKIPQFSVSQ